MLLGRRLTLPCEGHGKKTAYSEADNWIRYRFTGIRSESARESSERFPSRKAAVPKGLPD